MKIYDELVARGLIAQVTDDLNPYFFIWGFAQI